MTQQQTEVFMGAPIEWCKPKYERVGQYKRWTIKVDQFGDYAAFHPDEPNHPDMDGFPTLKEAKEWIDAY